MNEEIYAEVRKDVVRLGSPELVVWGDRWNRTGFTSVYGYGKLASEHIRKTGRTSGLGKYKLYSDMLLVDFDNEKEAAREFAEKLQDYNWTMYHSGNRSIHFHVQIEPMYGVNVPESQKHFVETLTGRADTSIYNPNGMYRLPDTVHKKTGKRKVRLMTHDGGKALRIPIRPRKVPQPSEGAEMDEKAYYDMLGGLMFKLAYEGGRHRHCLALVSCAQKAGLDENIARKKLASWNRNKCYPPKTEWEMEKVIRWVYGDR